MAVTQDLPDLPHPLTSFLSAYPHPAFVLAASPLHEALVARRPLGHPTSQDVDGSPIDLSTAPEPSLSSRSGTSSTAPSPADATPADQILSSAFATHSAASSAAVHPSRSSLLEGGDQIAHHPSRTAEGAVAAMYEQRAAEEGRREVLDRQRAISRSEEKVEGGWGGAQRVGGVGGREGMGKGLAELLKPVWGNARWADLVKKRGGEDDAELGVLALVGRQDAQKLLALLVNVLEPRSKEGYEANSGTPETTYTATIQLHFPVESIHHLPLASRRPAAPSRLSTLSASSDSTATVSSDSNAYTQTPSTTSNDVREPYLDLVATLLPSSDHLILTTVVHHLFTAPQPLPLVPPLSRPPLTQRPPSLSSVSSSSTIRPPITPALLSRTTEPQSTDRTPVPLAQYSGVPYGIPGVPSPPSEGFPQGYLVERTRTRRRFRGSGEGLEEIGERVGGARELTEEEERAEGVAGRERRREASGESGSTSASQSRRGSISASEMGGGVHEMDAIDEDALDSKLGVASRREGSTGLAPPPLDPNLIVPSPPSPPTSSRTNSLVSTPRSLFPDSDNPFLQFLSTTPMGRLIRAYAWERSPLGPILSWDLELKVMVTLMLASPFRGAIWYGEHNVLLYNDEYATLAGTKHPEILGKAGAEGWSEIWDTLGPLSAKVMQGETVSYFDHHLPMLRNGFLEETYHIWAFVPFRGPDGRVLGYDNPSFETTARVIAERRLGTIRDLAQITSLARTVKDYCQKTLHSISGNAYDLPFALLYTCELIPTTNRRGSESGARSHDATAKDVTTTASVKLTLEGTIGIPEDHASAPDEVMIALDFSTPHQSPSSHESEASSSTSVTASTSTPTGTAKATIWPFREALQKKKPVFIADLAGRTQGFAARGWPDEPKNAVCIPVMLEGDTTAIPKAVLIVGLNPRRPWNEVFATFLHLLTRQIATGLFSVASTEHDARRAEELVALDRAKTSFFANCSHELRTPLTLILGPLDDVLNSKDTLQPQDRERLLTVRRHANRLLNMVNTLLDFSRLEGGRFNATFRPTNMAAVTADLASLFRAAIERGKIEFVVDCEEDPSDGQPVYLAFELWEKIVCNLLGNAYKYTLEGRITIRVRFSAKEAVLQVIDTGCGIEEKELGRIFDRFHRVENTSRTHEGTGIGLALTLELVKVLGGTLEVVSEVGKGSTFSVRLPRGATHLPASQVVTKVAENVRLPQRAQHNLSIFEEAASWRIESSDSKEIQPSSASSSTSNHSSGDDTFLVTADLLNLKSSTVLLADDNHDLRTYIAGTLSKAFTVVQVEDGQAALEYCLRKPPSLVVTDIMMPRLDGRGLLAALRANPSTALIPVIFLSAEAGPEARVDALLHGVDDFLVKPFQSRELLARVNVHLQLGKMRSELERRVEERTRALIESEMRYRGLADRYSTLSVLSPVGIFMTDAEGRMSYANPKFYDISGHPTNKPLSEWRDSVLPEDLPRAEEIWVSAIRTGGGGKPQAQHMEFRWRQGNWAQFELRPFHESGSKRGFVGAITDITRMKQVEEEHIASTDQRAAEAEENRRQMELFVDMASHELRNPLSGVWQNADILGGSIERMLETLEEIQRDGVADSGDALEDLRQELQENAEAVDSILLCANHQGRIADDILNCSKISMGLLSIQFLSLDIISKVKEVLRMFDVECQQKVIALSLAVDDSIAALDAEWILGDGARLSQILINMLSNAVRYTAEAQVRKIVVHVAAFKGPPPPNPRAMRVAGPQSESQPTELSRENVWIEVGVEDSGKGLSSAELDRLFERFSQANPKSDQYGGSGLGLFVSKKLIELHSGFIEVESAPGQGSIFRFAIPAARAAPPPKGTPPLPIPAGPLLSIRTKRPTTGSGARTPISEEPPVPATAAPLHVLVVEDNLINQKVMVRQLKLAKFAVTVANNGQEALEILLSPKATTPGPSKIGVVLMDIEMPVMDGLTAIRKLRKLEADGVVPVPFGVIAVTGNARQGQIDACREAGFDDVAIKPYRMTELLAQIQVLTGVDPGSTAAPPI